jgi:hypothetical protein
MNKGTVYCILYGVKRAHEIGAFFTKLYTLNGWCLKPGDKKDKARPEMALPLILPTRY